MLLILTNNVNKVTVVKSSAVKTRPQPRLIASVQFSEAVPLQLLECWWLCSVTSTIVTVVVTVVASKSYCFKTLTKTSPHGACADISLSRPKPTFCSHWITWPTRASRSRMSVMLLGCVCRQPRHYITETLRHRRWQTGPEAHLYATILITQNGTVKLNVGKQATIWNKYLVLQ